MNRIGFLALGCLLLSACGGNKRTGPPPVASTRAPEPAPEEEGDEPAPLPDNVQPTLEPADFPVEAPDQPPPRPWDCATQGEESLAAAGDRLFQKERYGAAIICYEENFQLAVPAHPERSRFRLAASYALAGMPVNAERELRRLAGGDGPYAVQAKLLLNMYDRMTERNRAEVRRLEAALKRLIDETARPPR